MKIISIIIFIYFTNLSFCQEIILMGKVNLQIKNQDEIIFVENFSTEQRTQTNNEGVFYIKASAGQSLILTSINHKKTYQTINQNHIKNGIVYITMLQKIEELDEVVINNNKFTAKSLGILNKEPISYTPAERKLNTATNTYASFGLGFSIILDPVFNAISGRTKLLKKELLTEKNEFLFEELNNLFEENYFTEKLNIPQEYVKGFQYYAVENYDLQNALKDKNKTLAKFSMINLSKDYLKLIETNKD